MSANSFPPATAAQLALVLDVPESEILRLSARPNVHYRRRFRKTGKKVRELRVPSAEIKGLQRRILSKLRPLTRVSDAATGAPGRGVVDHASVHRGFKWCVTADIRDCFPSVRRATVVRRLIEVGFGSEAAEVLTGLTTCVNQLPQGAPTSTWLLDVVLAGLDDEMSARAADRGGVYTRYVDDIAISFPRHYPSELQVLRSRLRPLKLRLRKDKTIAFAAPQRASITGISVGEEDCRPTDDFLASLQRELELVHLAGGDIQACLRGRLAWVRQTNPLLAAEIESAQELRFQFD